MHACYVPGNVDGERYDQQEKNEYSTYCIFAFLQLFWSYDDFDCVEIR